MRSGFIAQGSSRFTGHVADTSDESIRRATPTSLFVDTLAQAHSGTVVDHNTAHVVAEPRPASTPLTPYGPVAEQTGDRPPQRLQLPAYARCFPRADVACIACSLALDLGQFPGRL